MFIYTGAKTTWVTGSSEVLSSKDCRLLHLPLCSLPFIQSSASVLSPGNWLYSPVWWSCSVVSTSSRPLPTSAPPAALVSLPPPPPLELKCPVSDLQCCRPVLPGRCRTSLDLERLAGLLLIVRSSLRRLWMGFMAQWFSTGGWRPNSGF